MHRKSTLICVFLILVFVFLFMGCSFQSSGHFTRKTAEEDSSDHSVGTKNAGTGTAAQKRNTVRQCLAPELSGTVTYGSDLVSIDASNTSEGYVMVRYQGNASKTKLQITVPKGTVYTYTLGSGDYETFPLSEGDGDYRLDVLENVQEDLYATVFTQNIQVKMQDEFKPFLYPNQYAWYTQGDETVACGIELSDASLDDLDYVERAYLYVIQNITYDTKLAATVKPGYLPDVDTTLKTKKGICFDYAALMVALFRSQGIPTKLQIGYSGDVYHAWISVYLAESGWVDDIIEFDGKSWSLMDPTLAASNSRSSVRKYIGDGNNYTLKYSY